MEIDEAVRELEALPATESNLQRIKETCIAALLGLDARIAKLESHRAEEQSTKVPAPTGQPSAQESPTPEQPAQVEEPAAQ